MGRQVDSGQANNPPMETLAKAIWEYGRESDTVWKQVCAYAVASKKSWEFYEQGISPTAEISAEFQAACDCLKQIGGKFGPSLGRLLMWRSSTCFDTDELKAWEALSEKVRTSFVEIISRTHDSITQRVPFNPPLARRSSNDLDYEILSNIEAESLRPQPRPDTPAKQVVVLEIDWARGLQVLSKDFERWASENCPPGTPTEGKRGRLKSPADLGATSLKELHALRHLASGQSGLCEDYTDRKSVAKAASTARTRFREFFGLDPVDMRSARNYDARRNSNSGN